MAERKIGSSSSSNSEAIQPGDECMSTGNLATEFKCHAKNCCKQFFSSCNDCNKDFCQWHLEDGNHLPCDRNKECIDNSPPLPVILSQIPNTIIFQYMNHV